MNCDSEAAIFDAAFNLPLLVGLESHGCVAMLHSKLTPPLNSCPIELPLREQIVSEAIPAMIVRAPVSITRAGMACGVPAAVGEEAEALKS